MNSAPIDLLLLTALTEEAQVTVAVLDAVATQVDETGGVRLYNYPLWPGRVARIAVASAHQMGAVAMGIFAAPLLARLRPRTACLIGIAAAVDTAAVHLGDVPFASQVFSYDDIAVEDGVLTFRTQGYQVDPMMRAAVGELRVSVATYRPWQEECERVIGTVVDILNQLRPAPIKPPKLERPSHLVVEIVAGGPFLLRDQDFREALRDLPKHRSSSVAAPVHPKLVSAEMESHGFMRAAHEHNVGAIVLKGISDVGDKNKAKVEKKTGGFFRAYACSNAVLAALHILRRREALSDRSHGVSEGGTTFALSEPTASAAPTRTSARSTPVNGWMLVDPANNLVANTQDIAHTSVGSDKSLLPSRESARDAIEPLLAENRAIFNEYGPDKDYKHDPESDLAHAWRRKVLSSIIPNNRSILSILDQNRRLLSKNELAILERFRQHVDDLEARHLGKGVAAVGRRFPPEMEFMLTDNDNDQSK